MKAPPKRKGNTGGEPIKMKVSRVCEATTEDKKEGNKKAGMAATIVGRVCETKRDDQLQLC